MSQTPTAKANYSVVVDADGQVYRLPIPYADPKFDAQDISRRLEASSWRLVEVLDLPPGPPLTVGELKARLSAWPDDMLVLADNGRDWYCYISDVVGPVPYVVGSGDGNGWSGDEGFSLPTLVSGRTFDARDL